MALSKVQDQVATQALLKFNRPIGVSIISRGQTWRDRQVIQYEAIKGLVKNDFHGLDDFKEQMELYSRTNMMILYSAWKLIRPLVGRNRKVLTKLFYDKTLGMWVGRALLKVVGFNKVFSLPTSILEDNGALKKRLSV